MGGMLDAILDARICPTSISPGSGEYDYAVPVDYAAVDRRVRENDYICVCEAKRRLSDCTVVNCIQNKGTKVLTLNLTAYAGYDM